AKTDRAAWTELVAEDSGAVLKSVDVIGGQLGFEYEKNATTELRLATLDGKNVRPVELPGLGTASDFQGLEDEDETYFQFSSFTLPRQVFKASVKTGKTSLWAKVEVPVDP